MERIASLHYLKIVAVACLTFLPGCDYGRMKEQPSLRPYEIALPDMPRDALPITGGHKIRRDIDGTAAQNPVPYSPESVTEGGRKYGYFCIMCHGPGADGNGTVGQSFSPLPTNLREKVVQKQTDGELFYTISFGFNRHPPLAQTVAAADIWNIINYLRSLPQEHYPGDTKTSVD